MADCLVVLVGGGLLIGVSGNDEVGCGMTMVSGCGGVVPNLVCIIQLAYLNASCSICRWIGWCWTNGKNKHRVEEERVERWGSVGCRRVPLVPPARCVKNWMVELLLGKHAQKLEARTKCYQSEDVDCKGPWDCITTSWWKWLMSSASFWYLERRTGVK